ncbi:hypothetical protein GGS20DRAFT_578687 [Poronia punctata]|nr:hypothetical protein GGS20DRAFT_578687 [Poronia punctata]
MATLHQQVPTPPCWFPDPNASPQGPESWVIYIVADTAGARRPLSAMAIEQADIDTVQPISLVLLCQQLAQILSDPSNQTAIAAELSVASDFYEDAESSGHTLALHELPVLDPHIDRAESHSHDYDGLPEFPFLATCIFLASILHVGLTPVPKPLGTVFRDGNPYFGMVVFDITSLNDVKYGIVALSSREMVHLATLDPWDAWNTLGHEFGGPRERRVESERPRQVMSAQAFLTKFGGGAEEQVDGRGSNILDGLDGLDEIWPLNEVPPGVALPIAKGQSIKSLVEITMARLIESTRDTDVLDESFVDELRQMPSFQTHLRHTMRSDYRKLGDTRSAGQLIALAFEGEIHLNLVRYRGHSATTIPAALERDELQGVKILSVCVDYLSGSAAELASALASCGPSLTEIYLVQSARRDNDQFSIDILLELSKYANINQRVSKVFASGVYSAECIVQRTQTNVRGRPRKYWTWMAVDIREALLSPIRLTTGLLDSLQALDYSPVRLASASPTLQDISRVEIGPLQTRNAADIFTVPPIWDIFDSGAQFLLISREKRWDREVHEHNMRTGGWAPTFFEYVRFAFVKILKDLRASEDLAAPRFFKKGDFTAYGLNKFLEDAMGSDKADTNLIERRLQEVGDSLANADGQGRRPDGLRPVDVLGEDEVCEALNEIVVLTSHDARAGQ